MLTKLSETHVRTLRAHDAMRKPRDYMITHPKMDEVRDTMRVDPPSTGSIARRDRGSERVRIPTEERGMTSMTQTLCLFGLSF